MSEDEDKQVIEIGEVEEIEGKTYIHMKDEPGMGFVTEGVEVPEEKGFENCRFGIDSLTDWNAAAFEVAHELNERDLDRGGIAKAVIPYHLYNRLSMKLRKIFA